MKKLLLFSFILIFNITYGQQAGDIVEIEQKLDLTPSGVAQLIAESSGEEVTPELLALLQDIDYGLLAYKLTYYTKDYNDNLVKATGLVMWPKTDKMLSTVLYCHPTTDKRENVPSNLKDILQVGFVLPLTYAISEYIVVAPDYYGYGDGDGRPNYTDAKTTAGSVLDMFTAANTFLDDLNMQRYDQNFLTGYSLGGHGGMATLKQAAEENSYQFDFAYLGAGPHDMSNSMLQGGVIEQTTFPFTAFLSYVIYTCDDLGYDLNNGDWHNVISDEYFDAFYQANIEQQFGLFWGPMVWRDLFKEEFITAVENDPNHPLRQYARDNNVYDWYNRTPTTLSGGWLDRTIPDTNNRVAQDTQRSYYPWWDWNKYKIKKVDMGFYNHVTGIVPYLLASVYEFNTRRYGGFFNTYASSANGRFQEPIELDYQRSSVENKITLGEKQLTPKSFDNQLKTEEDYVFVEQIALPNGVVKHYPVVREEAIEVEQEELLNQVGANGYKLNLHGLEDELQQVNIFRAGTRVKQYNHTSDAKELLIDAEQLKNGDLIEVVTNDLIFTTRYAKDIKLTPQQQQDITVSQQGETVVITKAKGQFTSVEVISQNGQIVFKGTDVSNQYNLALKRGLYIIRLADEGQNQYVEKVLVM